MASTAHLNKADAQKTPPLPLLPADNEDSELTILLKTYLKTKDIHKIWDAYRFSEEAHHGQSRRLLSSRRCLPKALIRLR